jgi:glycosyltransferase involved in cell wall biosynthesis
MSAIPVVYIIDHMGLGGVQTMLRTVLPHLPAHGFAPTVINLRRPTELSMALEADGVPVLSLDLPRWSPLQLPALTRQLRLLQPAIVHTHLTVGNIVGRLAAIVAGAQAIVMEDQISVSQDVYSVPPPVVLAYRLLEPLLARHTSLFLGPSLMVQQASAAAKRWPIERCRLVPNPVDCRRFAPAPDRALARAALGLPERPTIATFGRFVAQKRIGDVVEVARLVCASGASAQFVIAGSGPLEPELRRQIAQAGLEGSVFLLGHRQDTERILAASDCYLSASGGEVFSVAILEAMAAGCPVVATTAGGTAEQVTPGRTGYLARVGDVAGLAAAVTRLLNDEGARKHMGAAARREALERYDTPRVAARLAAIYGEIQARGHSLSTSLTS